MKEIPARVGGEKAGRNFDENHSVFFVGCGGAVGKEKRCPNRKNVLVYIFFQKGGGGGIV